MRIIKTNEPGQGIIRDIKRVEQACKEHDGLRGSVSLDYSLNIHPDMTSLFLLYEQEELVSFLSLFVPGGEEAEISSRLSAFIEKRSRRTPTRCTAWSRREKSAIQARFCFVY